MSGARDQVTAVVVAWRSSAFLAECLDSLLAQDYPGDLRVLVVDNAADEATRRVISEYAGRVGTVTSVTNRGFAGGVALALSRIRTPWALVINDDAVAAPDVVRLLVDAGTTDAVAAVQPSVRLGGGGATNSTGLAVTPDGYGYDRDWMRPWPDRDRSSDPFGCTGAAVLLRTEVVAAVGGMDPDLFLYYEDLDLAWRLRLTGHEAKHVPEAVVVHRHATSSIEGSAQFRFYNERNRLLVLARNASLRLAVTQWLRYPATLASVTVARGPRRAQTWVRVRAGWAAARGLQVALRKRRMLHPATARTVVEASFRPAPVTGPYRPSPDAGPAS